MTEERKHAILFAATILAASVSEAAGLVRAAHRETFLWVRRPDPLYRPAQQLTARGHHSAVQMKPIWTYHHFWRPVGETMPRLPRHEGRCSKRVELKRRASLVINLDSMPKRLPCFVLDSSKEGFRLRGSFNLRRGQAVEIVLDEDPPCGERCRVVWVGKAGSKQEGEVGLEAI